MRPDVFDTAKTHTNVRRNPNHGFNLFFRIFLEIRGQRCDSRVDKRRKAKASLWALRGRLEGAATVF